MRHGVTAGERLQELTRQLKDLKSVHEQALNTPSQAEFQQIEMRLKVWEDNAAAIRKYLADFPALVE